jgi:hypothetical protein
MVALLRRWGLRRDACLFGALVFTFSGFNLLHYVHLNAVAVISHLPWLLLGLDTVLRSTDRRGVAWAQAGVAALTSSQLLLGYPQYVGLSLLVEGAYALWLGGRRQTRGGGRWVALAGAKGLGLLGGCAQVLPTWDVLAGSWRRQPSAAFLGSYSLHPANLIQLLAPYLFAARHYNPDASAAPCPLHEANLYNGAIVPVLLAWLWCRRHALGPMRPLAGGPWRWGPRPWSSPSASTM